MTGTRDPHQDGSIHAMLSDSGLECAAELRSALEQLRAVVPDAAPTPRADLAALLAAGAAAPASATTTALPAVESAKDAADESLPTGITSLAERRGRKRRLAIVGGAVVGAMTLGAGAVAASSEDFRLSVNQSVDAIFQPEGDATQAPEPVQPSPASIPVFPAPAATSPAGTPGAAPSSNARTGAGSDGDEDSDKKAGRKPRTTPPAVGRNGILPTPGQRPGMPAPALPGYGNNGNGDGNGDDNEDLPRVPGRITPTLPGVVPTKAPVHP
ncbi:hypothetical protein [Arthrobacter sp. ok362]|uniref:hypothetical protein n=1 Tax=Arthrobacter sp. ok362 TaxID=1761745 RepID=UPI000885D9C5|nr:hypothetical protein [Arthrobacter sp. ok362]SDM09501.1 hypothetical protein SAMN04487913_12524 [Arthrobacter sp. ok362]